MPGEVARRGRGDGDRHHGGGGATTDVAVTLNYKTASGALRERLLNRTDEPNLALAVAARPWSFDGDGAMRQLAREAKQVDSAFLFDLVLAVHKSNFVPLTHQITAVRELLLPRQPLCAGG